MHPEIQGKFPLLSRLYRSSDVEHRDNYYSIYNGPRLSPGAESQFAEWERLLGLLDPASLSIFIKKAKGLICIRDKTGRDWSQFVHIFNELRGYEYAMSLGYDCVRLIDARDQSLPDIRASGAIGICLIEVKTIGESADELSKRRTVQKGKYGLPPRLTRVLKERYEQARAQLLAHPDSDGARKICFFIINLDQTVLYDPKNKELLRAFLAELESDVEVYSISRHWPSSHGD